MKLKLIFIKKLAGIETTTNYNQIDRKNITTGKSLVWRQAIKKPFSVEHLSNRKSQNRF